MFRVLGMYNFDLNLNFMLVFVILLVKNRMPAIIYNSIFEDPFFVFKEFFLENSVLMYS